MHPPREAHVTACVRAPNESRRPEAHVADATTLRGLPGLAPPPPPCAAPGTRPAWIRHRDTSRPWPTGYQSDIVLQMDVLLRDLPDELHAELARRAAASDMSLRAYLREVLSDHVAVPSMGDWLQRVGDLGPVPTVGSTGADLVAAARAEDDQLIGR